MSIIPSVQPRRRYPAKVEQQKKHVGQRGAPNVPVAGACAGKNGWLVRARQFAHDASCGREKSTSSINGISAKPPSASRNRLPHEEGLISEKRPKPAAAKGLPGFDPAQMRMALVELASERATAKRGISRHRALQTLQVLSGQLGVRVVEQEDVSPSPREPPRSSGCPGLGGVQQIVRSPGNTLLDRFFGLRPPPRRSRRPPRTRANPPRPARAPRVARQQGTMMLMETAAGGVGRGRLGAWYTDGLPLTWDDGSSSFAASP